MVLHSYVRFVVDAYYVIKLEVGVDDCGFTRKPRAVRRRPTYVSIYVVS
jgi:hypothetical protein